MSLVRVTNLPSAGRAKRPLIFPSVKAQALLVFKWTLYDGSVRQPGAEEGARGAGGRGGINVDAALRQEVRTALEELARADQALASARQTAALAAEALQLATEAYRLGATPSTSSTPSAAPATPRRRR